MPADHFSVLVPNSKIDEVAAFLVSSFQHLGFKEFMRPIPTVVGLGDNTPFLWLSGFDSSEIDEKALEIIGKKQHIALTAQS
jgi:hypothetical protein